MQFAIEVTVLECSFVKHSHGPLGVKEHFTSIVGSKGNRIYNCQSVQLRNNEFRVLEGVSDRQPFQNIIITFLYHEHFPHGTSTFNGTSVNPTLFN
jgi:hypothetical protein